MCDLEPLTCMFCIPWLAWWQSNLAVAPLYVSFSLYKYDHITRFPCEGRCATLNVYCIPANMQHTLSELTRPKWQNCGNQRKQIMMFKPCVHVNQGTTKVEVSDTSGNCKMCNSIHAGGRLRLNIYKKSLLRKHWKTVMYSCDYSTWYISWKPYHWHSIMDII